MTSGGNEETISGAKKTIGNAVARNRAKRRLRALVDGYFQEKNTAPLLDMILIARPRVLTRDFSRMQGDFKKAMGEVLV